MVTTPRPGSRPRLDSRNQSPDETRSALLPVRACGRRRAASVPRRLQRESPGRLLDDRRAHRRARARGRRRDRLLVRKRGGDRGGRRQRTRGLPRDLRARLRRCDRADLPRRDNAERRLRAGLSGQAPARARDARRRTRGRPRRQHPLLDCPHRPAEAQGASRSGSAEGRARREGTRSCSDGQARC